MLEIPDLLDGRKVSAPESKPSALSVCLDAIPDALRERDRWGLWGYRLVAGEWKKKPINPRSGHGLKSNRPDEWLSFDTVTEAYLAGRHQCDGIGFCLAGGDGLIGFDFDKCVADDGTVEGWATELLATLGPTYAELSPSGRGL